MVKSGSFQFTLSLLVLLTQLLDDLTLLFDLFLQTIVLALFVKHLFLSSLSFLDQGLLSDALLFKCQLQGTLLLGFDLLSFLEGCTSLHQLGLHVAHQLLQLAHLLGLLLRLVLLVLLFLLGYNLNIFAFLL